MSATWKQTGDGVWSRTTPTLMVVTHTDYGDYRAEIRGFRGGLNQIGYYAKREEAQKQCENKALGKPVTVGRRK